MANWQHFYLIRIEFLGFRYHGWQKQPKYRSVQGMIDKTLLFIFQHEDFKTMGCGRTDAKVSANDFVFELFVNEPVNTKELLDLLNTNLPSDVRAKSIKTVGADFNIIQSAKEKEYHYFFSFGAKSHPFNAPLIRDFGPHLDITVMQKGAALFLGENNFKRYASKPGENTVFERTILKSEIVVNTELTGSFVPEISYVYKVKSAGFLRYQVRLMVGALVDLGKGLMTLNEFKATLRNPDGEQIKHIAPSSGLVLHQVDI